MNPKRHSLTFVTTGYSVRRPRYWLVGCFPRPSFRPSNFGFDASKSVQLILVLSNEKRIVENAAGPRRAGNCGQSVSPSALGTPQGPIGRGRAARRPRERDGEERRGEALSIPGHTMILSNRDPSRPHSRYAAGHLFPHSQPTNLPRPSRE